MKSVAARSSRRKETRQAEFTHQTAWCVSLPAHTGECGLVSSVEGSAGCLEDRMGWRIIQLVLTTSWRTTSWRIGWAMGMAWNDRYPPAPRPLPARATSVTSPRHVMVALYRG